MRRNQKRISELKATIRKLEDRNSILVDERNELVCFNVIDVVCIDASWILSVAVKDKKQCQLWNDFCFFKDSACILSMHLLLCVVLETFLFLCLLFMNN